MKFVPNAVSSKVARAMLKTSKGSPTLLFGVGIVGMVGTTVLACKATLKVEAVLDEVDNQLKTVKEVRANHDSKYSENDAKKDKLYVILRGGVALGKLYWPALLCGTVSVAALTKSHGILNKRNAALTAAYATLDRGLKEYRDRVAEHVGREKEEDLYRGFEEIELRDKTTGKKQKTGHKRLGDNGHSIYARLFDENNKNWVTEPTMNAFFLKCQQNYLNDQLKARGHVFLNEAYDQLGLERTKEGAVVGWIWHGDGDNYIDFGIFNGPAQERVYEFVVGLEGAILLDFNVDGVIYDKI